MFLYGSSLIMFKHCLRGLESAVIAEVCEHSVLWDVTWVWQESLWKKKKKSYRCRSIIIHCPFSVLISHGSSVRFILSCQPYGSTAMVNYSLLFAVTFWLFAVVHCVWCCNKRTCFIWTFNEGWLENWSFMSVITVYIQLLALQLKCSGWQLLLCKYT